MYICFRTSFSFLFYSVSKNIEHRVWFLFYYIHLLFCPSTIHKDYYCSVFVFQLSLWFLCIVKGKLWIPYLSDIYVLKNLFWIFIKYYANELLIFLGLNVFYNFGVGQKVDLLCISYRYNVIQITQCVFCCQVFCDRTSCKVIQ